MPLIYGGQEEPLKKRLEFFEKDDIGFGKYEKEGWYKSMLDLKHKNEALWNGQFGGSVEFLQVEDQILSFSREKNGAKVYCILNLSNSPASTQIEFDLAGFTDVMQQNATKPSQGSTINLDSWAYKIYSKS